MIAEGLPWTISLQALVLIAEIIILLDIIDRQTDIRHKRKPYPCQLLSPVWVMTESLSIS